MNMFKSVSEIIEIIKSGKRLQNNGLTEGLYISAYKHGNNAVLICDDKNHCMYARLALGQFDDLGGAIKGGALARVWIKQNFNGNFYKVGRGLKLVKAEFSA